MKIRDVIKNIGSKSLIAAILAVILAFSATVMGGMLFYRTTKDDILRQGELHALQSAKEFDHYLLVRKDAVLLAASVLDDMLREQKPIGKIMDYLVMETQIIRRSIDPEITGLYGWINDTYCDGAFWVPDEDYVPTERPWYTETIADDSEVTFVKPYLDAQTGTVMTTMSSKLCDGKSVLALDIVLNRIQEITEDIAARTPDSYGIVLDKSGQVIAHSDGEELGKNYLEESGTLGAALADRVFRQGERQFELSYGGREYVVYAEHIEGDWHCISLVNTSVFFRPLKLIFASVLFLMLLEAAVFLAVFYNLSAKNLAISVQNVQIGAIADMYVTIYDIDLADDVVRLIRRMGDGKRFDPAIHGVPRALDELVASGVDEISRPVMTPFLDASTLVERLQHTQTVTEEYLDTERKWCRARFVSAERDAEGRTVRVLLMAESIDEEKRRRDRLQTLSETDQMTRLNNRTAGERKISARLNGGSGGMFVMVDIDKFKRINDCFGHEVGDKVIIAVADAMANAFRSTDIVMRLGGDEFVAFAPDVLTEETGGCIISRLFTNITEAKIDGLGDYRVYVSAGAAFCGYDELLPFDELYRRADGCAYESKKTVGNAVTFYRGA